MPLPEAHQGGTLIASIEPRNTIHERGLKGHAGAIERVGEHHLERAGEGVDASNRRTGADKAIIAGIVPSHREKTNKKRFVS